MGEREDHIATVEDLSPEEELLPLHGEGKQWRWRLIRGHFPVPAGCRHRNSVPPKLVFDGGGDRNCFWRKGVCNQGFLRGGKNRGQRGHREGPQSSQEGRGGRGAGLGGGRPRHPPGCLVVALLSYLGYSGSFRSADFLYNFSRIYWA